MTAVVDVDDVKPLMQAAGHHSNAHVTPADAITISLRKLVGGILALTLFGFFFCISYTYCFNFKASVYTHCEVNNFAPSISTSIGTFVPQRYVWQFCVALHSAPRLLLVKLDVKRIKHRVSSTVLNTYLVEACYWLQLVENLALLILSLVSSKENFPVHKMAFSSFVATSVLYMLLACYLQSRHCGYSAENSHERRGQTYKWNIMRATLATGLLLVIFYYRHNEYCEPYVYSFFCLCEYALVILNMAFHWASTHYDFYDIDIRIPLPSTRLPYNSK